MSMHQYIGARYIPRFMGNYDPGTIYEGLDVVDNGLGTSYIARKPVPAGIALTNTEYWAIYGASSGAIINLQNQIDTIDSEIVDINKKLTKKYIFIGDSYGHGSGSNGWIDYVVSLMNLSSTDYYDNALGGAGFTTSPNNFLSLLQTLYGSITDPNEITDIVILGGANDIAQEDYDVSAAIVAFNTYAIGAFPNAKIHVGMIGGTSDGTKIGTQFDRVLRGYVGCGIAEFLNNLQYVFHDYSLIGPDMVHPTATGYQVISNKIVEALNGGCSVNYYEKVTPSWPTGFSATTSAISIKVSVNNEITSINLGNRVGIYTTDSSRYLNIQTGVAIPICTINSKYVKGVLDSTYNNYQFATQTCNATVHSTINNQTYTLFGNLSLYNGILYFTTYDPQLSGTSAFTAVDEINIFGGAIVGNTMFF